MNGQTHLNSRDRVGRDDDDQRGRTLGTFGGVFAGLQRFGADLRAATGTGEHHRTTPTKGKIKTNRHVTEVEDERILV
ncbi:hypothetical protein [Fimbriiglobus ruber]|uniref:hypothetical protein n=1 Tax=Fimbriiglobus ruber TaxID=1908690 RepID=UPI00117B1B89|nr:hypothetical protein [Fimbriiglobus ruber]